MKGIPDNIKMQGIESDKTPLIYMGGVFNFALTASNVERKTVIIGNMQKFPPMQK